MLTLQADEAEEGDPGDQGAERAGEAGSGGKGGGCTGRANIKISNIIFFANINSSNLIAWQISDKYENRFHHYYKRPN